MEIFKIWSTFDLRGNALQKMEQYSKLVDTATKRTKSLDERLKITSTMLSSIATNLAKVNPEMGKLSTTFVRLNTNSNSAKRVFSEFNNVMNTTNNRAQSLINKTERLALNLDKVASRSRMASEGMMAMGGARISSGIMGKSKAALGAGLGYIGGGAMLAYAAGGVLKHGFDVSSEYKLMQGQLAALGYTPEQVASADKFVMGTNIKGVSKLNLMHAYIDAQMATREKPSDALGSKSEVKEFVPILAKFKFASEMYGGITNEEENNLIRFAEIMGGSSLDRRKQFLDAAAQIMVSSGLSIRPTELRTFARQAGGAYSNLSPEALAGLEPIFQESGGAKLATGLVTGLRQLITGTGSNFNKKQVEFLESKGILKATYDSEGRPLGVKMPAEFAKTAGTDPFAFLRDVIISQFQKNGVNTNNPDDLSYALTLGFGRTYSNELQKMWKGRTIIERQRSQLGDIGGVESQYQIALGQQGTAPKLVSAAWADFSKAIGDLTAPGITSGLKSLAAGLEHLAGFINAFHSNETLKGTSGLFGKHLTGIVDGHFSKHGAVSSAPKTNAANTTVVMQVDGQKLAKVTLPHVANSMSNGGVNRGTSYHNVSVTPTSTNYNNVGSP